MKYKRLKPHDYNRTLTELEQEDWGPPNYQSHLVTTCHKLRHKALKDFDAEDLRIMIGQRFSLPYLMPLAIKALDENPLISGDYYEGDLLFVAMTAGKEFYESRPDLWKTVHSISKRVRDQLLHHKVLGKEYAKVEQEFLASQ